MKIGKQFVRTVSFACVGWTGMLALMAAAHAQQLLPALGTFDAMGDVGGQAFQADGAVIVGGRFDWVAADTTHRNLVRFDAAGALEAWAPNPDGLVYDVELDAQGRIYVAGTFTTIAGTPRPGIARFLPGPTPTFDAGFVPALPTNALVDAIALRSDGTTYASYCVTGVTGCNVVRLDQNGNVMSGFVTTTNSAVYPMLLSGDESTLYVAGFMSQINGAGIGVGNIAESMPIPARTTRLGNRSRPARAVSARCCWMAAAI